MKHSPGFLKLVQSQRPKIKELSIDQVRDKQKSGERFVLIDVREDREWNQGRLPGAIHMGRGIIERDIEASPIQHDETIVLYCGGGFRSILSAANLQFMGYTNVYSMDGGYRGWREAGFPIEANES